MKIIYTLIASVILLFTGSNIFAQLSPLVIGTINPGDSIVVYYDVTINANAGTVVTNQGNITGAGIMLVTDDPDSGLPDDATVTLLYTSPLPVHLLDLSALGKGGAIELAWNVTGEAEMIRYEVERSSNGSDFAKIGEVAARNNPAITAYTFTDRLPYGGTNFYRLRMIDALGVKYSFIVSVKEGDANRGIRLFPNPIINSAIHLQFNNMPVGTYDLLIYNNAGQMVHRKRIHHKGGASVKNIDIPAGFTKGIYSIKVMNPNVVLSQFFIIQ